MSMNKFCPGSGTITSPMPDTIECPNCHGEVEIWTDEVKTICPSCKATVFKERIPSCIDWCKFAEKCIGPEVYKRLKGENGEGDLPSDGPNSVVEGQEAG